MTIIRGLSLTGPWDIPMTIPRAQSGKAVENRSRPIPNNLIGEYLALHTAKSFDAEAIPFIESRFAQSHISALNLTPNKKTHLETRAGYIVAVTRVVQCVRFEPRDPILGKLPAGWEDQERWSFGPWVYLLEDLIVFPYDPENAIDFRVPHKGALGFWQLEPKALELVRAQWVKARRSA